VTIPRPAEDAQWLRKLIAACDGSLEQLPADEAGTTSLRDDIASLRADLSARLKKLDTEDAA
jgi:hypothetical protein